MPQSNRFHAITLDKDRCVGCTNCIKRCPTQAIRIRAGKAKIISERCIDCGECIRACPYHAKRAHHDVLERLGGFAYTVALPTPTLYGQFARLNDVDPVLAGLKALGFDDVYEVAHAAEIHSEATRRLLLEGKLKRPVISSACPAVTRLIRLRFPSLCSHVLPLKAPREIAAMLAREKAVRETGLPAEQIGVFFLSSCPAAVTYINAPIGVDHSDIDGVLSLADIYPALLGHMNRLSPDAAAPASQSGVIGMGWSSVGGEAAGLLGETPLSADGVENVIKILEELENGQLHDLDFIELRACTGGCVGGVFAPVNGYVARARIQCLRKFMPVSRGHLEDVTDFDALRWDSRLESIPVLQLADNVGDAMRLMQELDAIHAALPQLDCGSCGAPSCRALAEDIVRGFAAAGDCVIQQRAAVHKAE